VNPSSAEAHTELRASRLSLSRRLALALPGAVAAVVVLGSGISILVGICLAEPGFWDPATVPGEEGWAWVPIIILVGGVVCCVAGLVLAAATVVVALARPLRFLLAVVALVMGCWAAGTFFLFAWSGAGAVLVLTLVLAYLTGVAVWRYRSIQDAANA